MKQTVTGKKPNGNNRAHLWGEVQDVTVNTSKKKIAGHTQWGKNSLNRVHNTKGGKRGRKREEVVRTVGIGKLAFSEKGQPSGEGPVCPIGTEGTSPGENVGENKKKGKKNCWQKGIAKGDWGQHRRNNLKSRGEGITAGYREGRSRTSHGFGEKVDQWKKRLQAGLTSERE